MEYSIIVFKVQNLYTVTLWLLPLQKWEKLFLQSSVCVCVCVCVYKSLSEKVEAAFRFIPLRNSKFHSAHDAQNCTSCILLLLLLLFHFTHIIIWDWSAWCLSTSIYASCWHSSSSLCFLYCHLECNLWLRHNSVDVEGTYATIDLLM